MNIKRQLFILWELPQFLLSLAVLGIIKKRISGSCRYMDTVIYFVNNFPGGLSLSYITFLNSRYADHTDIIKHEYGHSRQSLMLGWLYLPVVGIPSLTRSIVWNIKKLPATYYYNKFPENWANRLGNPSSSSGSSFSS